MNNYQNPRTGQPIGAPADDKPAALPGLVTLTGRFGRLEKLSPAHATSLWQAVQGHETLWTYMPSAGPFTAAADFSTLIAGRATQQVPYFYVIVDAADRACGAMALLNIRPDHRVIEVGHVLYAPGLQRTPLATEAQFLLARYVFETLGYRRYEWKCDALNSASRRAAQRYGFNFESIFRQHMIAKSRNRDTAWYAMLDSEWPGRKANFQRWLAPANFGPDGHQKLRLSELNSQAE